MKTPSRWLAAAATATAVATTAGLMAAAPAAHAVEISTAYGIVDNPVGSSLVRFSTTSPGTVSTQPLLGLNSAAQERVLAIDVRPATGVIYGVTSGSRLVTINPGTGQVTAVGSGTITPAVSGTTIGFDFNPVVDRIRLVSANQNLRINPVDVSVTVDTAPAAAGTGAAVVSGAAYTNSFAGAASTRLLAVDSGRDVLVNQEPNSGVLTSIGTGLGHNVTAVNGFDIAAADNTAFAALQENTESATSRLFKIDLTTGVASAVGTFPNGTILRGLTLASPGVVGFPAPTSGDANYRVAESGNGIELTVNRTGGSEGSVTVRYSTANGSATAGEDYTATSGTLTFAPGETSKPFTVPVLPDQDVEGPETFTVTLSNPTGGAGLLGLPGAPSTQPADPAYQRTVTITDAQTGTLYGVTRDRQLVTFTINGPGSATTRPINGLQEGEEPNGIDLRPEDGKLYITTNRSRLLTVDTATATTGGVNSTLKGVITPPLNGSLFGVDFNPTVDRLRVTSDNDQNLRVHPDTPASSVADSTLRYADGANPSISAVAYTNNVKGATTTRIFGLDDSRDVLVSSTAPNDGLYQNVGATGVNFTGINGFDISGRGGLALAALVPSDRTASSLYRVDLTTGKVFDLGPIATSGITGANLVLTGLTFGETGTATPPPGQPGPNPPAQDTAPARITLEIGARNNTITAGNRPELSGFVTNKDGRGIANREVQILQKVYNDDTYRVLQTERPVRTDSNGRYSLRVAPDRQRAYVARVAGTTKQSDQDGQRADVVFVHNRVNIAAPQGGARLGRQTVVRGDLDPDFGSIPVGVAMLRDGRFTYLTQGNTDSRGGYSISVRNLPVGQYALVVYTSARQGTLFGSASRAVTVR